MCFLKLVGMCLRSLCRPLQSIFSKYNDTQHLKLLGFINGYALGQTYNYCLLKKIAFPCYLGGILSVAISLILGIGNAVSVQMRCISLLMFPMYCGKAGRSVLKAVLLTYVVAGPITNLGMNAKEVVRVFACSTELTYNLSRERHILIATPFRKTALGISKEIERMEDALSTIGHIVAPIEHEIENGYVEESKRPVSLHKLTRIYRREDQATLYEKRYKDKLVSRCEEQIYEAVVTCFKLFRSAYRSCTDGITEIIAWLVCWPLKLEYVCNILPIISDNTTCDARNKVEPGLGQGYMALINAKNKLTDFTDVSVQYEIIYEKELLDIQDAKETGTRVIHAFEEKTKIMRTALVVLNVGVALLALRIVWAAVAYHDAYLTSIDHDNVYITEYFQRLDERRRREYKFTLLPLKKMERIKYIDILSLKFKTTDHSKLLAQMLKLMLEVVTATTFVMLDRLFYEALDMVRQYAETEIGQTNPDTYIEVEGTGMLATLLRKLLTELTSKTLNQTRQVFTNKQCLPRPRAMPAIYYFKIYGGYLWILLLLYINPYTVGLSRRICSCFYPRREKQRILHLYNDILKKRMKMQKTLRRKAVQAVRAHYLSAENLLSLRMKFPKVLGWLKVLPAARMPCLICGETQPRTEIDMAPESRWHSCRLPKCPFVYCRECWQETGARCLACDPTLAELSDVDSFSE